MMAILHISSYILYSFAHCILLAYIEGLYVCSMLIKVYKLSFVKSIAHASEGVCRAKLLHFKNSYICKMPWSNSLANNLSWRLWCLRLKETRIMVRLLA